MTPAERLGRELADLKRQVSGLSRAAQLSRSSVTVDGEDITVADGVRRAAEALVDARTAAEQATAALTAADGKNTVTYSPADPDGTAPGTATGDLWFTRDGATGTISAIWEWTGSAWAALELDDAVLRSLTVGKLVSGEVSAGVRVIFGPETGAHAEGTSTGFYVYATDPDGQVVEVGRFGTGGEDRFLITDGAGQSLASIDSSGGASFARLDVDEEITVGGNPLSYLRDQSPRGLVARAGVDESTTPTSTVLGSYDVEFLAEPGRAYRISTSTLNLTTSTTSTYGLASLIARPSAQGPPSVSVGKVIVAGRGSSNLAGGIEAFALTKVVSFDELFSGTPPTVPTKVRVMLAYGVLSGGGTVALFGSSDYPIHTYIEDVGVERPFTGVINNGGGTTATPVVQYQTDWAAQWGANWQSNSSARRTDQSEGIQGYTSYYPAGGIGIAQVGFGVGGVRSDGQLTGTIAVELAGATINWAAVYVYSTHWNYDTGGTVLLGGHPYSSVPGTKPADWQLSGLVSSGHPKPGGKWIYLPAGWFGGLANGTTKGITLGDGVSTSPEYYGRFAVDPSDNRRPVIRINYSK